LKRQLTAVLAGGYDSAIVFTQYTDTMEYVREFLSQELPDFAVGSYFGDGGAWRENSGNWVRCNKEEIKRRLRDGQIRLLVATDAAGEGLNLQTCGAMINYDLPWNPMKLEQRIGRIDRLGQRYPKVRIINLAYKGTVEADVYFMLGSRIQLFQGIVGKLQPILSRLPKKLEQITLTKADNRDAERQRFLAEVENQVSEAEHAPLDIDRAALESLEMPPLPEAALSLDQIDQAISAGADLPSQLEWSPLDARSYAARLPGMAERVRVTTDAAVFEYSGDSHQLFSPGGFLFDAVQELGAPKLEESDSDGICWIADPGEGAPLRFLLRTRYGTEEIQSLSHLLQRLGDIDVPGMLKEGGPMERVLRVV